MKAQTFSVPIALDVGITKKKTYYLNLNGYKQWHFQVSNQLKKLFKVQVAGSIRKLKPVTNPIKIIYTIFYPTKREFDLDNVGSVISKFTHDALVELDILPDDNYNVVTEIKYQFGGVDKENPRCDVRIEEV